MANHTFICRPCEYQEDDTSTHVHTCPLCGEDMDWDLSGIGIAPGDYRHESHSLAIHPSQVAEHKKLFPGIEVSREGCPTFTSPRQQEKYANACGFDKKAQRNRRRGKRL